MNLSKSGNPFTRKSNISKKREVISKEYEEDTGPSLDLSIYQRHGHDIRNR